MKKALMTIALACMATASFGYISVNWNALKLYDSDSKTIATANEDVKQILWELVYTTQTAVVSDKPTLNVADKGAPDITKANVTYRDGDQVLATRIWDSSASDKMLLKEGSADAVELKFDAAKGKLSVTADGVYENTTMSGGSVYAAIFRFMEDGSVYWNCTGLDALTTPTSDSMLTAASVGNWPTKGAYITTLFREAPTEVPEPATMGLLGLGALAMVIRRKLRK